MLLAALLATALPQTPAAQTVTAVDEAFEGRPTEVAVLGSAHLSEFGERLATARLEPLIARLERWRPEVITVEAATGRDCDEAAARPDLFGSEPNPYCRIAFAARTTLKLDQVGAERVIDDALRKPMTERTLAWRRDLAGLFLAAGEPGSALVHWLQLPPAERRATDRLGPDLVAALDRYAASRNETYAIAAVLAARLGLDRVHPTDDHQAGRHVMPLGEPYGEALKAIWDNPVGKRAAAERERETGRFLDGGDVLAYYRWLNAPATLAEQMQADFAAAAADRAGGSAGRLYLAYWETRNLRMVANMRFAFGDRPGARVLVVVGNSHKPYFERYFATQSDMRIVDIEDVFR